jgi:hypothetical protein
VVFAALKHTHEKVGDTWKRKDKGGRGPSDAQAAGGRDTNRPTAGGVDANASKRHLYDLAKQLKIPGRSSMSKTELVTALQKANDRVSAKSRARKSSKTTRASKKSKKSKKSKGSKKSK